MKKFKRSDEYYLTKPLDVKTSEKSTSIVFDAGVPIQYVRYDEKLGYIFTVRNMYVSISFKEDVVDENISTFNEEAVRRAK